MSLLDIFATAILPVVTIAAVGVALGRLTDIDPGPLNTAIVYVLAPALVVHSLATTAFGGETVIKVALSVVAYIVAMLVIAEAAGRLLGTAEPKLSALVLAATFPNAGNYGVPLSDFAFPDGGRAVAVLYLGVQAVVMFTVGTYVASRAGGASGLRGLRRVARLPLVWAVPAALALRYLGVVPPTESTAMQTLQLVGDSSIPLMLLVLGIQLSRTQYGRALSQAVLPSVLKTAVAPAIAVAIALAVGFRDPTVARVFVLECATPAAITPLILVTEFADSADAGGVTAPEFVSTTILVTTLLSVPVLTVLIALLQDGLLV